jgi:hypothetical protein
MSYIGPKEVKSVEDVAEKHNGTIDLVKVTYADDTVDTLTKKCFDVSVTDAPLDLTSLRDRRTQPIAKAILELLLEYGVPLADVNFITTTVAVSINASVDAANTKIWGKAEQDVNLIEIDNVIRKTLTVTDLLKEQ